MFVQLISIALLGTASYAFGLTPYVEDFASSASIAEWTAVQASPATVVQWSSAGSGCMIMNVQDATPGNESITCVLDGSLLGGEPVEANVRFINTANTYYRARVQLWNTTDDVLLSESEEVLVYGLSHLDYAPVDVRVVYQSVAADAGDAVELRIKEASNATYRNIVVDRASVDILPEASCPAKNLIKNGGFDARYENVGGGTVPVCWTRAYGSNEQVRTSTTTLQQGYRSLLLDDRGDSSIGVVSDWVSVSPGANYTAGVDVKCTYTPSKGILYLRFYDANGSQVLSRSAGSTSASWTPLTVTAMAPSNAVSAELLCYVMSGADTGFVYFDNAYLIQDADMVANGSWDGVPLGELPECWEQYNAANPASVELENGTNVLQLADNSSTENMGACTIVPASPRTPYKLSALAKKVSGEAPGLWIYFLDSSQNVIVGTRSLVTSSVWSSCDVRAISPEGTAYIKVLMYSTGGGVGTACFKDLHLSEDFTMYYVGPDGSGDGLSPATPALYTSSSLWSAVDGAAASHPVKVVFQSGSYTNNSHVSLENMGNFAHAIVLEGERPYGSVFAGRYAVRVYESTNMVLRNIHFNAPEAEAGVVVVGQQGRETRNITVSDCSFINLTNITYGSVSVGGSETYDVTFSDCEFIRIGKPNDGSHMIYNSWSSYNINLLSNYFEDGWGSYVKIRSGSSGYRIVGNTFVQNNGYRAISSDKPFIHFSAINAVAGSDEVLGTDYLIEGNRFEYNLHPTYPLWIYVVGDAPANHPGYHEVTLAEKQVVENQQASAADRNGVLIDNFGVDVLNDWVISGNVYSNTASTKFYMRQVDPPAGYEEVAAVLDALIDD